MAKKKSKNTTLKKELLATLMLFLVVLTTVSLISYSPQDPSFNHQVFSSTQIHNFFGLLGAHLAGILVGALGVSAFGIPILLAICSYLFFKQPKSAGFIVIVSGGSIIMVSTASFFTILIETYELWQTDYASGGWFGRTMASFFLKYTNTPGTVIILMFILFVGVLVSTGLSAMALMKAINNGVGSLFSFVKKPARRFANIFLGIGRGIRGRALGQMPGLSIKSITWNRQGYSSNEGESLLLNDESTERDMSAVSDSGHSIKHSAVGGADRLISPVGEFEDGSGSFENVAQDFTKARERSGGIFKNVLKKTRKKSSNNETSTLNNLQRGNSAIMSSKKAENGPAIFESDFASLNEGEFILPPLSLLNDKEKEAEGPNLASLQMKAEILEEKLKDFGVKGEIVDILPGPVITTFEYRPAPGVKISKIVNLTDDIALALSALSIRINAPIPGKDVVGVEIPNDEREIVILKEMLASEAFISSSSKLTLGLGKDILGKPFSAKMDRMPHLLIAGATGTGKSVGLNSMIISLLYKATPDEVKFIMVDPKRIELSVYDDIPHLISPVVTDMKKATNALFWAVREMERRYELLAENGVRNLTQYNALIVKRLEEIEKQYGQSKGREDKVTNPSFDGEETGKSFHKNKNKREESILEEDRERSDSDIPSTENDFSANANESDEVTIPFEGETTTDEGESDDEPGVMETLEKLPYIVVIVDEFADLMMVASKDVESALIRLAQMARAAGIHLVLATQRPSVDVLTGIIKANFPTRLSFQVSSRTDSRTILDTNGSERLLGNGDMLFLPPGTGRLQRIQGAYISEEEIARVTSFLKKQQQPQYVEDVTEKVDEDTSGGEEEEYDEKYDEAVAIVTRTRQASISSVQRHLRIGYNRAARIIETMEREGLVGPQDGSKPREVLVKSYDD